VSANYFLRVARNDFDNEDFMKNIFPSLLRTTTASVVHRDRYSVSNLVPVPNGVAQLDITVRCPCCGAAKDQLKPMWDKERPSSWIIYCTFCHYVGPECRTIDEAIMAFGSIAASKTAPVPLPATGHCASRIFEGIDGDLITGSMAKAYLRKTPVHSAQYFQGGQNHE
jgi:hypothetical protein